MWKNCLGVLLIGLSIAIGACVAPEEARRDDQAAQVDRSVAGTPAQVVGDELESTFENQHFVCNGTQPGLPIPVEKEDQFSACMPACLNGPFHPTFGVCWGTCCRQVTATPSLPGGCAQCFIQ